MSELKQTIARLEEDVKNIRASSATLTDIVDAESKLAELHGDLREQSRSKITVVIAVFSALASIVGLYFTAQQLRQTAEHNREALAIEGSRRLAERKAETYGTLLTQFLWHLEGHSYQRQLDPKIAQRLQDLMNYISGPISLHGSEGVQAAARHAVEYANFVHGNTITDNPLHCANGSQGEEVYRGKTLFKCSAIKGNPKLADARNTACGSYGRAVLDALTICARQDFERALLTPLGGKTLPPGVGSPCELTEREMLNAATNGGHKAALSEKVKKMIESHLSSEFVKSGNWTNCQAFFDQQFAFDKK